MGCTLSIQVANPQEEALQTEVAALRKTVLDLQVVVRTIEKEKTSTSPIAPVVVPTVAPPTKLVGEEDDDKEPTPSVSGLSLASAGGGGEARGAHVDQVVEVTDPGLLGDHLQAAIVGLVER